MKKYVLIIAFFLFGFLIANQCDAQVWPNNPYVYGYPRTVIGYYPQVQWYSYGTNMQVGPVVVFPNSRNVRFGTTVNFRRYRGFFTFNYTTGEYVYYPW